MSFLSTPDLEQRLLLDAVLGQVVIAERFECADPIRLFELARHQFVSGVLAERVLEVVGPATSATPLLRMAEAEREGALDAFLRQMCTYLDVATSLEGADVDHLVLKGPTSARLYTHEFERHAGDLDVLISDPAKADRAVGCMIAAGWEPAERWLEWSAKRRARWIRHRKDLAFRKPGDRTFVELHWRASASRREWPGTADPFDDVRTVGVGGRSVPSLGAGDERLYLLHHGTKHGWRRLKWIVDMQRLADVLGRSRFVGTLRADCRLDEHGLRHALDVLEVLLEGLAPTSSTSAAYVWTTPDSDARRSGSSRLSIANRVRVGMVGLGLEQHEREHARQVGAAALVRGKLVRSLAEVVMAGDRPKTIVRLATDFTRGLSRRRR